MIEKMTLEDISAVAQIDRAVLNGRWSEKDFLYELEENPVAELYVLKKDNRVIGFLDLWIIFERAEIANIALDSNMQGCGLGQKLLDFAFEKAALAGCEYMFLEVRETNFKARDFYAKNGFTLVRCRKQYYGDTKEDALELVKDVMLPYEENISY